MFDRTLFWALLSLFFSSEIAAAPDCTYELQYNENDPVLMDPSLSEFVYPDSQHVISFKKDEIVRFVCPGLGNRLLNNTASLWVQELNVKCASGDIFYTVSSNGKINITEVTCSIRARSFIPDMFRKGPCGRAPGTLSEKYEVLFTLPSGHVKLYEVCVNTSTFIPIFTNHTAVPELGGGYRPKGWSTQFKRGDAFTTFNPSPLYEYSNQVKLFNNLSVNIPLDSNNYAQRLSRGHNVPSADFIFVYQKAATYLYENTAPQWNESNAGDWEGLERSVRNLAGYRRNLIVLTGTFGQSELKNSSGSSVPIVLSSSQGKMIVPAFFWKVVHDKDSKQAVAIVQANKPYGTPLLADSKKCTNSFCANLKWLTNKGDLYCCSIPFFRELVDFPELDNVDKDLLAGLSSAPQPAAGMTITVCSTIFVILQTFTFSSISSSLNNVLQ